MGNRAVIQFGESKDALGIYLHWNGGEESVRAFLNAAKHYAVRDKDDSYKIARLAQIIGNFFGGTTSVGVDLASNLDQDNGDNGTYIVEGLDIVKRVYLRMGDDKAVDYSMAIPLPKDDAERSDAIYAEVIKRNDPHFVKEVA
jgi:hypothetical protein